MSVTDSPRGGAGPGMVDRNGIPRRLEAAGESPGCSRRLSSEERKKILRARAKQLAGAPDRRLGSVGSADAVEFLLAHERYAFYFSHVREACFVKEITPLPGVPPFVAGIVSVRGRILSVIDLKKFFDLSDRGLSDLNRLIVLSSGRMEFGILADAILGIRSLASEELQPALPTLTGTREAYLKGISRDGLIVLDAAKILSDKRIVVQEEV